jgi:hypothetical protein
LCAFSKDIEYQGCAVDYLHLERVLKVTLLCWRKLVVEYNQVVAYLFAQCDQLVYLTFAYVVGMVRLLHVLDDRAFHLCARRLCQLRQLFDGVLSRPLACAAFYLYAYE